MYATRALRQAAVHAERTPLIRFIGKRNVPGMFMCYNTSASNLGSAVPTFRNNP